jgi:LacI family transcriptional regulator
MSVTILDVAKRAGVGVGTVSRVINNTGNVSDDTRQRVETAMLALGYVPNTAARNLKSHTINAIGFFFGTSQRKLSDPFLSTLLAGIADAADEISHDLLVASCPQPADEIYRLERLIRGNRVSGVILTDTRVHDPRVAMLQKRKFPYIAFGRLAGRNDAPFVDVENKRGIEMAVRHLQSLGHRRIAFIGLPEELTCAQDRKAGYIGAMRSMLGSPPPELWLARGGLSESDGERATHQLLSASDAPTAIVCSSDTLAFGALRALRQRGLRTGDDIALIGFDNLPTSAHATPSLSTIHQPIYDIGRELTGMLVRHVRGEQVSPRWITPELIVRDSSGPGVQLNRAA